MAYVAITDKLKNDVQRFMRDLEGKEKLGERMPDPPKTFDCKTDDFLRVYAWGVLAGTDYVGHKELANKDTTTVGFVVRGENCKARVHVEVHNWPKWRSTYEDVRVERAYHPYFEALYQWANVNHETETRWQKIRVQVLEFLGSCKSLNEALKLWPDLRRYVGAEYLARIDQKQEKEKRDPSAAIAKLKAMDLETIAASTVTARLAGAAGSQ